MGQHVLVHKLGDELFFQDDQKSRDALIHRPKDFLEPAMLINEYNNYMYLSLCNQGYSNTLTDSENQKRTTILSRDFTGLDCVAWVYDMTRPDEPYISRGEHPYGEGIDRYRSLEDLSNLERDWLKETQQVYLLNFLNPHFIGIHGFNLQKKNIRVLPQLGSVQTPFGYTIDGKLNIQNYKNERGYTLLLRNHVSGFLKWNPEIQFHIFDITNNDAYTFDFRTSIWTQPKNLRWDDTVRQLGGSFYVIPTRKISNRASLFGEFGYKSLGFMEGEVYLERKFRVLLGVKSYL